MKKLAVGEKPKPGWYLVGVHTTNEFVKKGFRKLQNLNTSWTLAIPIIEAHITRDGWIAKLPKVNFFKHPETGKAGFWARKYWDEKSSTFFFWVKFEKVGS